MYDYGFFSYDSKADFLRRSEEFWNPDSSVVQLMIFKYCNYRSSERRRRAIQRVCGLYVARIG